VIYTGIQVAFFNEEPVHDPRVFVRSIELPAQCRRKRQKQIKNGVLEIQLPNTEEVKKKEITVKVE